MFDRIEQLLTPRRRRYLYRIAWAGFGAAGTYGVMTADQAGAGLLIAAALLGMADAHVDEHQGEQQP